MPWHSCGRSSTRASRWRRSATGRGCSSRRTSSGAGGSPHTRACRPTSATPAATGSTSRSYPTTDWSRAASPTTSRRSATRRSRSSPKASTWRPPSRASRRLSKSPLAGLRTGSACYASYSSSLLTSPPCAVRAQMTAMSTAMMIVFQTGCSWMVVKARRALTVAAIAPTVRARTLPLKPPTPAKKRAAPTMMWNHPQVELCCCKTASTPGKFDLWISMPSPSSIANPPPITIMNPANVIQPTAPLLMSSFRAMFPPRSVRRMLTRRAERPQLRGKGGSAGRVDELGAFDRAQQVLGLVRLLQDRPNAHVVAALPDLGGAERREDDDRDRRRPLVVAKRLERRESVHHRHHEVQDDDVGCLPLRRRVPAGAFVGDEHLVATELQKHPQHVGDRRLVVDHEDPCHLLDVRARARCD